MLARPSLAARSLRAGMEIPGSLNEPVVLGNGDFVDETHTRIFALLVEHAEDPSAVLSDERSRPLMDEISALQAAGERLYPSNASLQAAWFRFVALSREKAKLSTDDFDEKFRLHTEIKRLNAAAIEASNLTFESESATRSYTQLVHSSPVLNRQSIRLLTEGLLVRVQPGELGATVGASRGFRPRPPADRPPGPIAQLVRASDS